MQHESCQPPIPPNLSQRIRQPQYPKSLGVESRITREISGLLFLVLVARPIDFDDEVPREAYEVCNDVSQDDLPLKLSVLATPIASSAPNVLLGPDGMARCSRATGASRRTMARPLIRPAIALRFAQGVA